MGAGDMLPSQHCAASPWIQAPHCPAGIFSMSGREHAWDGASSGLAALLYPLLGDLRCF